jgi:hypothetical protein
VEHRALASLILRIAGLLVIVYSITNAAKTLMPVFMPSTAPPLSGWPITLTVVVGVVLPVAIGLVLIYFPGPIASAALRVDGVEVAPDEIGPLQQVAFSAIGLWLALFAIVDAAYYYGKTRLYLRYVEDSPTYVKMPPLLPDDFGGYVSCVIQLILGILLIVGSRGLVKVLARLRG